MILVLVLLANPTMARRLLNLLLPSPVLALTLLPSAVLKGLMRRHGMAVLVDSATTSLVHGTRSLPSRLTLVLTSAKVFRTTTHRSPTSAPVVSLISQLTAPTLTGLSTLTVFLLSTLVPLLLVSF